MATAAQILSLVRSHAQGDSEHFFTVAMQVASEAARRHQTKLAQDLKSLIDEARQAGNAFEKTKDPIPVVRPRGELAGLLSAGYPKTNLDDLVLPKRLTGQLQRVVKEQREWQKLADHGLEPRRKFLLSGPPGSGKTMTAAALAGELHLPLFSIQLDGVITRFMGETAAKLRLVFDAMSNARGVYFFDEVDAIASSRLSPNDVGEARRVLNSFLQFLDEDRSDSLILAATNHPTLLDQAIFRRFHGSLQYALPDETLIRSVLEKNLVTFDLDDIDWKVAIKKGVGLSQAELARAAEDAARDAVLENSGNVTTELLVRAIEERKTGAE